jgi:hypothetical protein
MRGSTGTGTRGQFYHLQRSANEPENAERPVCVSRAVPDGAWSLLTSGRRGETPLATSGVAPCGLIPRKGEWLGGDADRYLSICRSACEHMFVQSPGSAHAQLRRALDRDNLLSALSAARDCPVVPLEEALELCLLIREKDSERYGRAGARWAARWSAELPSVDLQEAQLVHAALASLGGPDGRAGAWTLLALSRRRKLRQLEKVLLRFLDSTS